MTSTTAKPRLVQYCVPSWRIGRAADVGPPWMRTSSGGSSPCRRGRLRVGRRIEESVGGATAGAGERDRLRHREPRRIKAQVAGRAQHVGLAGLETQPDDGGLRRRRGADEDDVVARGRHRGDRRVRRIDVADGPVRRCASEVVEAVALVGEHDAAVGSEGVPRLSERPLRHADLGVDLDPRLDLAGRCPAVEVPPAGAVGHEPQRSVGVPAGLGDGLAVGAAVTGPVRSARHDLRRPEARAVGPDVDRRDAQLGAVPRHVGVVPLQPAEAGAVGREAGVGDEVRTGDDDRRLELAGGVEHHDLVDHLSVGGVPLAHDGEPPAGRIEVAVGPAIAAGHRGLRSHGHGHRPAGEPVQPLVVPVGEPQRPAAHPPRSPAVLVHGGAGVEPGGQQIHGRALADALDDLRPPALLRSLLRPGDGVAVDGDAAEAGGRPHHELGGDGVGHEP